jgi:hypothetical protein
VSEVIIQFQCVTLHLINVFLRQAGMKHNPLHIPPLLIPHFPSTQQCASTKNQTVGPHSDYFLPRGICFSSHAVHISMTHTFCVVCIKLYSMNKVGVWHKEKTCYIDQKHGYSSLELIPVCDMRDKRNHIAYITCDSDIPGISSHMEMMKEGLRFLTWL